MPWACRTNAVVKDEANKPPRFRAGGVDSAAEHRSRYRRHGDECEALHRRERAAEHDCCRHPANVGMPVVADDPNGDTLTYTLSGNDAGSFDIDPANGQISAKMKLDKEAKSSHMVTVTATDPNGASASIDVTITVTNVDEAPTIVVGGLVLSGPGSLNYAEDRTDAVGTYTASGPDADMATWSLDGDDAGCLQHQWRRMLTFRPSPDYENPADADNDNVYSVTVNATDGTNDASMDVTVTVTNVDELGTLTGMPASPIWRMAWMPSGPTRRGRCGYLVAGGRRRRRLQHQWRRTYLPFVA